MELLLFLTAISPLCKSIPEVPSILTTPVPLGVKVIFPFETETIYKKFLKLFNNSSERHVDWGNGTLYYKRGMEYPTDIDPKKEYLEFIKFQLQNNWNKYLWICWKKHIGKN